MAVDYRRLRSLTAGDLVRALTRDGFRLRNQVGSHMRFAHHDGRRVTVTFHHAGQTFPPKTLKSMIERQAKWANADLERLGLL